MAGKASAGILLYRIHLGELQVFIVHPGGPFWASKDAGAWSIPKGEIERGCDALETAIREFREETGRPVSGDFLPLTALKQASGKVVHAWAVAGDIDPSSLESNTFTMEWPPRSGKEQEFPEVDRGGWFSIAEASERLLPGQRGFLAELQQKLGVAPPPSTAASRRGNLS